MLCLKENENYEKKKQFRQRERNREERIKYYQTLRNLIKVQGSKSLLLIDESGFEEFPACVMPGQEKEKKSMGIDKENGEKEKIQQQEEEKETRT